MAGRKPPEGSKFRPGQSGNPNGRPPLPQDLKDAKKLNTAEFDRCANRFLWMTRTELGERLKAADCSVLESVVGTVLAKSIQTGDHHRLNFILDRLVGKVQDRVEITHPTPFIIEKRDGGQVVMGVSAPIEAAS